jgi:hypothetical protein
VQHVNGRGIRPLIAAPPQPSRGREPEGDGDYETGNS